VVFHPVVFKLLVWCGAEGYVSTLSLTSALDVVGGQRRVPAALPPEKTGYPLYRRLGGPQSRSGRAQKISPPNGIRSPDRPGRSESLYRLLYPVPAVTQVQFETSLPGNRNEVLPFVAQYIVVDTSCTEYYPLWWKIVHSMSKIPFASVSKLGLSLYRY